MSEKRERSGLFKFFYVIIRIITFPIYMVLFILRHPIWVMFLLLLAGGGAYYYPTSQGVKSEEILDWYKNKLIVVQKEVVARAEEKGMKDFVPRVVVDNVKQIEEEEKEREREALSPRSENYNSKVEYDEKAEETKLKLKKRGGFKKQKTSDVSEEDTDNKQDNGENESVEEQKEEVELLEKNGKQVGGLSAFVKSRNLEIEAEGVEQDNSVREEVPASQDKSVGNDDNIEAVIVEEVSVVSEEPVAKSDDAEISPENAMIAPEEVSPASEGEVLPSEEKTENMPDKSVTEEQQVGSEAKEESSLPTVEEKADVKEKDDDMELDFF